MLALKVCHDVLESVQACNLPPGQTISHTAYVLAASC